MKVILLVFCLINFISCYEYILKAGIKSEGYCENNNFIFKYDYNYFVNDLVPNFKNEFSLLIEKDEVDYIAQCKINLQNFFSSDFEILCIIENYFGCMSGSLDSPQYIKEEPNSIYLNDDDYLIFEGFTDTNIPYLDDTNITITAGNIIEKYIKNEDFVFKINYTCTCPEEEIEKIVRDFNLPILVKNNGTIDAICSLEALNITCKIPKKKVNNGIYSDIYITGNPIDIELNGTTSIKFQNFTDLETYSIRAGKIDIGKCVNTRYNFKIFNIRSSSNIPENKELVIKVRNITAKCPIKAQSSAYSTTCFIDGCPDYIDYIELTNSQNETNTTIFSPNSLFFYDFNSKRTISIKGGKLIKGECQKLNIENNQFTYNYAFVNNSINFTDNKKLEFVLYTSFGSKESEEKYSICEMNVSGFDNTVNCSLKLGECPNEEDDIYIKQNITKDYNSNLSPNSVFYFDFDNKKTTTIKATNKSMIIKQEKNFIITDNIVEEVIKSYSIKINITFSDENELVQCDCSIPDIEKNTAFNITCNIENVLYSLEKDIEIVDEPIDKEYNYFFYGYKNKKTVTLKAGNLIKDNDKNNSFGIINNTFLNDRSLFSGKNVEFDIKYNKNPADKIKCTFNKIKYIKNYVNISCSLPDDVKEIEYISVMNNPKPELIDKKTTLYYLYFENLNLYSISLGNIIKKGYDEDNNNYIFYFYNTNISSKKEENITLNIPIMINDENNISICEIISNKIEFNMKCKIEGFKPISNIDISCELDNYFTSNNYTSIYIDNFNSSTTTLTSGYLKKGSLDNTNYNFYIKNNKLSGNRNIDIGGVFNLKLVEFSSNAICEIMPKENNEIKCYVSLNEIEKDFCLNMYQDINVSSVKYNEYHYILINNHVLHLNSFENLATHTIEAGEIIRGNCSDRNIYTFLIKDSLPYNDLFLEDKISFNLNLSKPRELSVRCTLPESITKNKTFDIECNSTDSGDICPIFLPSDEILTIKADPDNITDQSIYFNNFIDKTTLISINGGSLRKSKYDSDNKIYYFLIENSTSTFNLSKNINFNLNIEVESSERQANCILNHNNLMISCEINEIDSEKINIKIKNNSLDDSKSNPEKIIGFFKFEDKKINAVIAGKLTKGKCEKNIYKFTIKDSKSHFNFTNKFSLQLKEPNNSALCNMTKFDEFNNLCDIECSFKETSSCTSQYEGKDLIAGDINPEFMEIDVNNTVYFYDFNKITTIVYEIKVGNLIKLRFDKDESRYYFRFDNEPFSLPNFKEDISFTFNMSYNNSQVTANCELTRINAIQNTTVDLYCYFPLNEEMRQRDDLLNYDISIGQDINENKKVINSTQELNLIGFDNKETITLSGKNIKNKYEKNNKIYFIIDYKSAKEISNDFKFEIIFNIDTSQKNFKANCSYNIESKEIICEDINNKINIDDNIIIKSILDYPIISDNQSLYFINFENMRTYTIKAGLIEKLDCSSNATYNFTLINTSSPYIPEKATIEIPIFINNTEYHIAKCDLQISPRYNMDCNIEDTTCASSIILNYDIEPNETLFYPYTTFFNDFNNKRTITIKSGRIKKGECKPALPSPDSKYYFTLIDNEIDYQYDKVIEFNLDILFNSQLFTSYCNISISGKDDTIYCHLIRCPMSVDDLHVSSKPENDYKSFYPNSIFFENFLKNTTTIVMGETGLIIKNQMEFIITNNYVKEKVAIDNQFNVIMKIKINGKESESSCTIPLINEEEIFNITCYAYLLQEEEIEIIEEPEKDDYYFSGYKNKRTLTLKAGSLYKYNNKNLFDIRNSEFSEEYSLKNNFEFHMNCKYNDEKPEDTLCSLNTSGILNSDINIICTTSISDIKTIAVLSNPNIIQLNKDITLYFTGFENLNLYTLTPGYIIKGKCESNSFTFNLNNSDISKSLSDQISIKIPLTIIGETNKTSSCKIVQDIIKFNMSCTINDYCPENNIDIKIEELHSTDINVIRPNSLYININSEIQTSTLNLGYLKKEEKCDNEKYIFSINNNFLSGKNIDNIKSEFKLKLVQFSNQADCSLDSLSINCNIFLKPDEKDYCEDFNKDIKFEELIDNENRYLILEDHIILHLYGIDNLETYTIKGGELNQGNYKDNIYKFSLINSLSYNKITLTETNKKFYLPLNKPNYINADCSLPLNIEKENNFDINCEIKGNIYSYIIETRNENPQDIKHNTQYISFRGFGNKNTEIKLTAGQLKLENNGPSNYYLNFTDSNININLNRNISFDIETKMNNDPKNITCNLYQNSKDIQCNLEKITNKNISRIYISKDPNENLNIIEGKTVTFTNFINKEINIFIAGYLEKGGCDEDDAVNYQFFFKNCISFTNYVGTEFDLQMTLPNSTGHCKIIHLSPLQNLHNVRCTIKGEDSCTIVNNIDFTVGDIEPETKKLSDLNALYYINFTGQSTVDKRTKYYFNGGILSKKSVENSGSKALYTFNIEDCSLNIPLTEDYEFTISISLDIYEDYSNINYKGKAKCTIPKEISDINGTNIKIECSFTTPDSTYYTNKENYDILIEDGNQMNKIDEDHIIYISKLNDLSTVTMYGCQINKGQCDSNNKYTFNFNSCIIHKEIPNYQDFEFNLKAKTGQNSVCKIYEQTSINCEIKDYSLCGQNNDIVIDNNVTQINKTKYPLFKNLYILGLKNLYTTSLNGGAYNLGQCQSTNFFFHFNHTKLTNELSQSITFNLQIKKPIITISSCTIPKGKKEFDLQCIIKDANKCPISDPLSLKIEEITEEKSLEFIRPNALYINNLINKNDIILKAGTMTAGQCNDKKYEIYFINSEIINEVKGEITQDSLFTVNLKYPSSYKLNCTLPKNIKTNPNFNLYCYIEGYSRCPMYDYTYIETSDNNPELNESLIPPNVVKFSNFNNQKINFDNYYLELKSINWECSEDIYNFNLTSKFNVNVTEKVAFNINVTKNKEPKNVEYICSISDNIKQGTNSLITCSMKEKTLLLDNNLNLNFDIIKLEEKNQYIINQGTKRFINNNVQCPYVHIDTNSTIIPSMNPTDKSIQFSMNLNTTYINKEIKIYDKTTKKPKDYLELKLKPFTTIKYFYKFLSLLSDDSFEIKCDVPKKTTESVQINCTGANITDTKSDYFGTESNDIIEIEGIEFEIDSKKIKNPFKKDDGGNDDKEGGLSTAGKVVLIIFIVLVFAAIILALVYYFCFYKKRNNDTSVDGSNRNSGQQSNHHRSQGDNNPNQQNPQQNSQSNQSSSSDGSQQHSNQSNRKIKNRDPTFEY